MLVKDTLSCVRYSSVYEKTHTFLLLVTPIYNIYARIYIYRKTSNIRRTVVGNKIVDHADVVGDGWSIACRRCSNYIFILDLTSGFKGFGKESRKTVR